MDFKLLTKRTILAIFCLVAPASFISSDNQGRAEDIKLPGAPAIDFVERFYDFGKVKENVEVRHTFIVLNRGNTALTVDKVSSSCGCTIPIMKVKTIEPGGSAPLEIVMDTAMKQGKVTKTIEVVSNDPKTPKAILQFSVTVENLHAGLNLEQRAKIFEGRCAMCHVQDGFGLEGADLYKADCGMCHGYKGQGAVGPALVPRDYSDPLVFAYLEKITSYGSKSHASMPGFLMESGGPLTAKEIKSILQFLQKESQKN